MGIYNDASLCYVYDDNDTTGGHAAGQPHTFAEIAAACAAVFITSGGTLPSYRATLSIQYGDKVGGTIDASGTGTNTTTITDTSGCVVEFAAGKTITRRASMTANNCHITLGTKVGSGNEASGKYGNRISFGTSFVPTSYGTCALYGVYLSWTAGTWLMLAKGTGTWDWQNCLFHDAATGNAPYVIGATGQSLGNIYNCDFTHATTTNNVVNNLFADSCERVTLAASAPASILNFSFPDITMKDCKFIGSPTQSDIRWTAANVGNNVLVRPVWTGNAAKFSCGSSGNPTLANGTQEKWLFDCHVVDGSGMGIAGIPVTLTDTLGNVAVSTVTEADGGLTFGSGLTTKAVTVMDHYTSSGTTYAQRHRSPFLCEINTGAGANGNYPSKRFNFYWPGYSSITTTAGAFEDVELIVNLQEPYGGATSWVEAEMP